jgi:hypothetical protein
MKECTIHRAYIFYEVNLKGHVLLIFSTPVYIRGANKPVRKSSISTIVAQFTLATPY